MTGRLAAVAFIIFIFQRFSAFIRNRPCLCVHFYCEKMRIVWPTRSQFSMSKKKNIIKLILRCSISLYWETEWLANGFWMSVVVTTKSSCYTWIRFYFTNHFPQIIAIANQNNNQKLKQKKNYIKFHIKLIRSDVKLLITYSKWKYKVHTASINFIFSDEFYCEMMQQFSYTFCTLELEK